MSYRLLLVIALIAFGVLLLIAGVQAGTGVRSLALASPLPPPMTPQAYLPTIINMTPPLSTTSHYVEEVDESIFNRQGCAEADKRRQGQNVVVILDFGYPAYYNGRYGALTLDPETFYPTDVISEEVKGYLTGFYVCAQVHNNDARLTLAMGVNNHHPRSPYISGVTLEHGRAWAQMVNDLNDWIEDHNWQNTLRVYGANDIEFEWNTYDVTIQWVNGYTETWSFPSYYLNFGSCDSCPSSQFWWWVPANGWTLENIRTVSWGAPPAWPLPEIYLRDGLNADQWSWINHLYTSPMYFTGALTQYGACHSPQPRSCNGTDNTPEQGWSQLWDWINRYPNTQQSELRWSTDILWDVDWPQPPK